LNIAIATQIKVLREQREWRQEDLAEEAEMTQPMVSRYENVNYSSWSINTLKKFALAYDVWLDVRFRPFGELVRTTEEFGREALQVPKFDDDPFFKEVQNEQEKEVASAVMNYWAGFQPELETTPLDSLLLQHEKIQPNPVGGLIEDRRKTPVANAALAAAA
jgi:transcriptional regulator with XRE-family HTH domain